jgi:hypothetical protein
MHLHLIKLCVGADSIENLARWQSGRRKGGPNAVYHYTRFMPKRADEVVKGGSIYWVIKGFIQVRQRIVGFDYQEIEEKGRVCGIKLDRKLVPTEPMARRPHQGWRYFLPADAPPDLPRRGRRATGAPVEMLKHLKGLGLI